MQIPFRHFEQHIDETILKRGLDYFKNGFVNPPEEITAGKYEAVVEGTENYTVQLEIKNETITDYNCTCPYDFGPICKHIVAVIFYLQQEELNLEQKPKKKRTEKTIRKKKTISEQVNELLDKLSQDDLKEFIRKNAEHNSPFRNIFLSSFAHHNENESKEFYAKQVKSILRSAMGRDRFIDYSSTHFVGNAVYDLVSSAQKHFENKNYKSAIFMCCAVMEEMVEALQFSDDSNGDIGGPIDVAYELLHNISTSEISEDTRKHLFEYCLSAHRKNIFSGWDWHLEMLEIASQIIKNENEAEQVITLLDATKSSDYQEEKSQQIKLQLIRKTKGEKEAEKFIEQNLSNPSLRKEFIQKFIDEKNFTKAISIAEDGIRYDAKDRPGLAMEWYDWLLKIAMVQNDKEKIIQYARSLFVDSIREKKPYYELMKTSIDVNDWKIFVERLISDLARKNHLGNFHQVADIFITEQWWDRLLSWLQQNSVSLEGIAHYEKYLAKDFSEEISDLYEKNIVDYLKNRTGRSHYQNACRYMRRMLKLGAKEKVDRMVAKFKNQYTQRRALMEELDRI